MNKKAIPFEVNVHTKYVVEQSDSDHHKYVWSYEVTIENHGDEIVQLLHRFWHIVDMTGKIEEVHGAGVIGLQPLIKPGTRFIYTSFCQLHTPQGTMEGHYEMQNLDEKRFRVEIPKFILSAPTVVSGAFRSRLH